MSHKPSQVNTILIVDDAPENIGVLSELLNTHELLIAKTGENVLEKARDTCPDLILLDIMMPKMDGFEICRCLKNEPKTREIPVIFMSVLSDLRDKIRGFELGAADYVSKPIQRQEVLARVNAHLTIRNLQRELKEANSGLERLASLDGLTRIASRCSFDEHLKQKWEQIAYQKLWLSIIICDIDYFKLYNDTYGHQAGDDCLRLVAGGIRRAAKRRADLAARYGCEEFAAVLSATDAEGAMLVAKSIQKEIKKLKIPHSQSTVSKFITLSMGICSTVPGQNDSPQVLVAAADAALSAAKAQGRNRIVLKSFLA
ncbi:MAG: diguanylate cyclase [Gammaproteobacteria bacterium]|nr:diguanylate cyclase [Gammaproteobacteria bacterium]